MSVDDTDRLEAVINALVDHARNLDRDARLARRRWNDAKESGRKDAASFLVEYGRISSDAEEAKSCLAIALMAKDDDPALTYDDYAEKAERAIDSGNWQESFGSSYPRY